jgi:hypothetical protein
VSLARRKLPDRRQLFLDALRARIDMISPDARPGLRKLQAEIEAMTAQEFFQLEREAAELLYQQRKGRAAL